MTGFYIQATAVFDTLRFFRFLSISADAAAVSRPPGLTDELLWGVLTAVTEPA